MLLKKFALYVLLPLSVTSCNNDGGDNGASEPSTVAEALTAADQSGAYPQLNRDTSVAGPDVNNNGVRDDIDTYISSLPDSALQKAALIQSSSSITNAMTIDIADQNALTNALKQIANASACLHARYDSSTASSKSSDMEKLTVNTKERSTAYEAFSTAVSGQSFVLPQGDGCAN
ncbi:hypothetical protein ACFODT_09470 [Vibrio zhugei]|uniref:Lipoprotein n=1 Tax=Vibrio zhugei TaxID=2479546 RepID=A0ABV7C9X6_9VIBR|nr:hypothetical protein [Vibrio zhugei]